MHDLIVLYYARKFQKTIHIVKHVREIIYVLHVLIKHFMGTSVMIHVAIVLEIVI